MRSVNCLCFATSVTNPAARIDEGLACFGNKLPIVSARMQRELQDAETIRATDFAVRMRWTKRALIFAARAGNKFSDSALGVGLAVGILWSKSFVVVVVAVHD